MSYKDLIAALKSKKYAPVYFLHGEESFYIDKVIQFIEQEVLAPHEKSFNQTILYGKEADYNAIVDAARRFPMMAERQVVVLKEAQEMKDLPKLEKYIERPSPTTILAIAYKHKKFDSRTKLAKILAANGVIVEFKKLYDNQIAGWIKTYMQEAGYNILPEAAQLVTEFVGNDLSKIANELDKLVINIEKNTTITIQHVKENIGISRDYNVFELQNALVFKNVLKAQRIVSYFASNSKQHPLSQILLSLYGFFSKIYIIKSCNWQQTKDEELAKKIGTVAFFLKEYKKAAETYSKEQLEGIFEQLRTCDLRSKGIETGQTSEGELLKELIFRILH